jgi:hypothetical protein
MKLTKEHLLNKIQYLETQVDELKIDMKTVHDILRSKHRLNLYFAIEQCAKVAENYFEDDKSEGIQIAQEIRKLHNVAPVSKKGN